MDNLRKKRCLPEAIEQLVVQGLTSDAAVALVTHVVTDFGLQSISTQSEAFYELARSEEAGEAEDSAEVAAIGAKKLCRTSRPLVEFKAAYDLAKSQALVFIYFCESAYRAVSAISFWRSDLRKCVDLEAGRARC